MTISSTPNPPPADPSEDPLTVLRAGGGARVNLAKLRQVITAVILVSLAVLSIVFFFGGAHKNNQITSLSQHGVPVTVKVTGCEGLLGGSGSNEAGYICSGAFTLNGHRYTEQLPGSSFERPGTVVHEVSLPSDPGLLETPAQVADDHSSDRVYILPAVFLVAFLALGTVVALHLRRRSSAG